MADEEDVAADELLRPVFQTFKRQARAAIEAAQAEISNVLRVHYDAPEDRLPANVPAPRLQLRWEHDASGRSDWLCSYELVMPLGEHDCRNDAKTGCGVIELGRTRVRGGGVPPWQRELPQDRVPFRDGAHAKWDAAALGGLPIYVIGPDGIGSLLDDTQRDGAPT